MQPQSQSQLQAVLAQINSGQAKRTGAGAVEKKLSKTKAAALEAAEANKMSSMKAKLKA